MSHYLLSIDQGTTNSRAIIFNRNAEIIAKSDVSLTQFYPRDGWVEQDPKEIIDNTILCCQQALQIANLTAYEIAGIGISNQRETTLVWDRTTGDPIYPAIVWQDRRTAFLCEKFAFLADSIQKKTGLLLDPYFSATKLLWILDNVENARARMQNLLFGTVDTFLLWKLTRGKVHATDVTNASRTLLFNLHTQTWDDEILEHLSIPKSLLPQVFDNAHEFGRIDKSILGAEIPIAGMAGDQQAALIGQACFKEGMLKVTYGTGAFMVLNTGNKIIASKNQLLSTVAYRINHEITYGLEGSIFCTGATIKWLRDTLKIIATAAETEDLAKSLHSNEGVYLVPAFTGLGAPYWEPNARAALCGLTRNSGVASIARAALESVAYQTRDLLEAVLLDITFPLQELRVDGGMAINDWMLQFIADILSIKLRRSSCIETSALGVAYLAGLQIGFYNSLEEIAALEKMPEEFNGQMSVTARENLYVAWKKAVRKVLS